MNETLISILFGLSFLVGLILTGFLWWIAYRFLAARRFWGLLATGWTLNVLSSIVWGLYATFVGEDIPNLVDTLFVARYVFVGLALWLYPTTLVHLNSDIGVEGQSHWPFWAVVAPWTPNTVGLLTLISKLQLGSQT